MKGILRIVRGEEVKINLPAAKVIIKADGTLWYQGIPILGITDDNTKRRVISDIKAGKYDSIPAYAWVRLGYNDNGIWAGDDDMWATHPVKMQQDKKAEEEKTEKRKQVRIWLSSCGWGDYSPVEWIGDITKSDKEILSECKSALIMGHDVDSASQTDAEILGKINAARTKWEGAPARKAAIKEDIENKISTGYCFNCESYCDGDCGNYSGNPEIKYRRKLAQANAEENYGIED